MCGGLSLSGPFSYLKNWKRYRVQI